MHKQDTYYHYSVLSEGSKKNCVYAYTCILALAYNKHMHNAHSTEFYLALVYSVCINKTQDTILVSCQLSDGSKTIVFTHTLVLLGLLIISICTCYRGLFSACLNSMHKQDTGAQVTQNHVIIY